MTPKYVEGWGSIRGGTSLAWTHLLLGRKLCQRLVVKVEVGGDGVTPIGNNYQQKNMYVCAPLWG